MTIAMITVIKLEVCVSLSEYFKAQQVLSQVTWYSLLLTLALALVDRLLACTLNADACCVETDIFSPK